MPERHTIFGYGSLIEQESRCRTIPSAGASLPARLRGFRRGWFKRGDDPAIPTTYLGITEATEASCNGVLFTADADDLRRLDLRESGYDRIPLDRSQLIALAPHDAAISLPERTNEIWTYRARILRPPCPDYPILQSYVDICLHGCLQVERRFPDTRSQRFSVEFLETTDGWSRHIENDRGLPKRADSTLPDISEIDRLLTKIPTNCRQP